MSSELRALAHAVLQPGFTGTTPPDWLRRRLSAGLGGVALFARNVQDPEQVAKLTAAIHAENPLALVAIDEEGGDVTRLEHHRGSSWPGNLALGAVDDVDLTYQVAAGIGADLAGVGIDFDYAPSADANSNPANPVIGVRSFGSDPALVARHTAAFVKGLQSTGVMACVKHFPGHGDTDIDSHEGVPVVDLAADPLAAGQLDPFVAAIEAGVAAVMTGHIVAPLLDDRPATISHAILAGLLRERLGFRGLVVTDGIEMGAISRTVGLAEGAVQAVAAGADAICVGGGLAGEDTVELLVSSLVQAVLEGRLSEERLAQAARWVEVTAQRAAAQRAAASRAASQPGEPSEAGQLAGDRTVGRDAARRALRVAGHVPPITRAPQLVEFAEVANIAVGETASGLRLAMRERWPDLAVDRFTRGELEQVGSPLAIIDPARPVVIVIRDAHRRPWMQRAVTQVLAARPDAVTVEVGVPQWRPPGGSAHLVTYGDALVCGRAAVEVLMGGIR